MSEKISPTEKEVALADEVYPSCTPAAWIRLYMKLPNEVNGKKIVDVCAGASNLVAQLLDEGADAHAIDRAFKRDTFDEDAREALEGAISYSSPAFYAPMRILGEETLTEFSESRMAHPDAYHDDYMTQLPFDDESVDFLYSCNGIASLDLDSPELMLAGINEALRVIKKDGTIVIGPIFTPDGFSMYTDFPAVHLEAIATLRKREDLNVILEHYEPPIEEVMMPPIQRLVITKKAS